MKPQKIAIIGGGASGLVASILLAKSKKFNITIFEKNNKVGKKLFATGNGKCNISNKNIDIENYYYNDFVYNAIKTFDNRMLHKFFNSIGLELIDMPNGKIFPATLQASSVVKLLEYEAISYGVKICLNASIDNIYTKCDKFYIKYNSQNYIYDKLIMATGSNAMTKLGGSDTGYKLACLFKHNIIKPYPSLVQLVSKQHEFQSLAGTKLESNISLYANNKVIAKSYGDILFTKYGVSGNAILDISRNVQKLIDENNKLHISADIYPTIEYKQLCQILHNRAKNNNKDKYFWLIGFLHSSIIHYIIDKNVDAKITTASQLDRKTINQIAYTIKNIKIQITDTKGFETAEVSSGGVDTKEIDPHTMESLKQKNLYFIGEIVDIDGQCGGYNLHWAWASSHICANSIIQTSP